MYEMLFPGVEICAMTMCHFSVSLENVDSYLTVTCTFPLYSLL